MCRGVAKWDGAWGKKQVWRPHVRTWVFRKQMYCFEKLLMTLLWLLAPSSDSPPGELWPLAPLVTSLVVCNKNLKIFWKQTNFNVRTSWTSIPWTSAIFERNAPWILHRVTANEGYWQHFRFLRVVLCHFYACPTRFFGVYLCLFCW